VDQQKQRGDAMKNVLCAALCALLAAVLWPVSYFTHFEAAGEGSGIWFFVVSAVSLFAAIGATGAVATFLYEEISSSKIPD
jgi:hypothetical protein